MPKSSNILICDMPLRFDNYKGCGHSCNYCFVKLKYDISNINTDESHITLFNWIKKRQNETKHKDVYPDDMPLHWGGVSDPFQPIEKTVKSSLKCLSVFEKTQYPFVVSTKGILLIKNQYLDIIKNSNCVIQISALCSKYDRIEINAPTYNERIKAAGILAKYKRVLLRLQPYHPAILDDVLQNLKVIKESGVYGIIFEAMKYKTKAKGTIKLRGDNVFYFDIVKEHFDIIKKEANQLGIKCFAGENRLRQFGDGLNCCGVGDLYNCHTANLNHLLFDKLDKLDNKENGIVSRQDTKTANLFKKLNYGNILYLALSDKSILSNYTLDKQAIDNLIYHKNLIYNYNLDNSIEIK